MKCDNHPDRPALLTVVNNAAGIYKRQCLECRLEELLKTERPREIGTFDPRDETPIYESHRAFAERVLREAIGSNSTRAIARSGVKPWEEHDERPL